MDISRTIRVTPVFLRYSEVVFHTQKHVSSMIELLEIYSLGEKSGNGEGNVHRGLELADNRDGDKFDDRKIYYVRVRVSISKTFIIRSIIMNFDLINLNISHGFVGDLSV